MFLRAYSTVALALGLSAAFPVAVKAQMNEAGEFFTDQTSKCQKQCR